MAASKNPNYQEQFCRCRPLFLLHFIFFNFKNCPHWVFFLFYILELNTSCHWLHIWVSVARSVEGLLSTSGLYKVGEPGWERRCVWSQTPGWSEHWHWRPRTTSLFLNCLSGFKLAATHLKYKKMNSSKWFDCDLCEKISCVDFSNKFWLPCKTGVSQAADKSGWINAGHIVQRKKHPDLLTTPTLNCIVFDTKIPLNLVRQRCFWSFFFFDNVM